MAQSVELEEQERQALREALDDEYHAWATYDQVIADFGAVRPFINTQVLRHHVWPSALLPVEHANQARE